MKYPEKGTEMPTLSTFYGISIRMYSEVGTRHHVPHIHCEYAENEVVISLDGNVLEGDMPKSKLTLIYAWIEIHKEELEANWKLLSEGERHFRIEPLK